MGEQAPVGCGEARVVRQAARGHGEDAAQQPWRSAARQVQGVGPETHCNRDFAMPTTQSSADTPMKHPRVQKSQNGWRLLGALADPGFRSGAQKMEASSMQVPAGCKCALPRPDGHAASCSPPPRGDAAKVKRMARSERQAGVDGQARGRCETKSALPGIHAPGPGEHVLNCDRCRRQTSRCSTLAGDAGFDVSRVVLFLASAWGPKAAATRKSFPDMQAVSPAGGRAVGRAAVERVTSRGPRVHQHAEGPAARSRTPARPSRASRREPPSRRRSS